MRLVTSYLRTPEQLSEMVEYYLAQPGFSFDTENVGTKKGSALQPVGNRTTWVSLATRGRADVIPMGHPVGELLVPAHSKKEAWFDTSDLTKSGNPKKKWRTVHVPGQFTEKPPQLRPSEVFPVLEPLLFSTQHTIVGHNLLYDLATVAKYYGGKIPPPPYADTQMMAHLTDENRRIYGLKELSRKLLDFVYEDTDVAKDLNNQPFSKVATYALCDARATWMLYEYLSYDIEQDQLDRVLQVESELVEVLAAMKLRGVQVNPDHLVGLSDRFHARLREIEKEMFRHAGKVFNPTGTVDKRWYVYDLCGHKPFAFTEKTKEPSTKNNVLESFADADSRVALLIEHGAYSKLISAFVGEVDEDTSHVNGGLVPFLLDGRVYPSFKPHGTVTGRFSCSEPNVQQIPSRSEDGALIRQAFEAEPGRLLVVADYSQVEYRVLAHYCEDPTLLEAFEKGWDPHAATAALVLGKDIEDVSKDERSTFKNVNFAQIYGAGISKLAGMCGMSEPQMKAFVRIYEQRFPRVLSWKDYVVKTAKSRRPVPYVCTVLGRRRRLPELFYADDGLRMYAERQAVNSIVQGSAADAMKVAMVKVYRHIQAYEHDWQMQMTVHDELMLSVPEEEAEVATATLKELMESVDLFKVPLAVEASYGKNWGECK